MGTEVVSEEVEYHRIAKTTILKRVEEIPFDVLPDIQAIFGSAFPRDSTRLIVKSTPPDSSEKILGLPRILPPDHNFSDNIIVVCEQMAGGSHAMVFAIDPRREVHNFFHVLTTSFPRKFPFHKHNGYAISCGRLYFVGGCYPEHNLRVCKRKLINKIVLADGGSYTNVNLANIMDEVQQSVPDEKLLDVPTYNLTTGKCDLVDNPKLNGPKPKPIVFVYEDKIFALAGKSPYPLRDNSILFEYLETNPGGAGGSAVWTPLPPPPVSMKYFSHHLLYMERGSLFLFFKIPHKSRDPTPFCCEFRLKARKKQRALIWVKHMPSTGSSRNPLRMLRVSQLQSPDCIVDDILFCYESEHKCGKPVIVGHDLGGGEIRREQWVIDGLDKVFGQEVNCFVSSSFLNHIRDMRFCLVLQYPTGKGNRSRCIFSLTFELVKNPMENVGYPKASNSQKGNLFLKPIWHGAFQIPFSFSLNFCDNL